MAVDIGVGLLLNILFWTVAVLVAVGIASLAVIEYFPGRATTARTRTRREGGGTPAAGPRVEADDKGEGYRKAS